MVDQGWIFSICPVMAYQVIAKMQGTSLSRRWTLGIEATVGRLWACSRLVTVATIICAVGVLGIVNEMYMESTLWQGEASFSATATYLLLRHSAWHFFNMYYQIPGELKELTKLCS